MSTPKDITSGDEVTTHTDTEIKTSSSSIFTYTGVDGVTYDLDHKIHVFPQKGPQLDFSLCKADIALYGGAAGGGKSYALLLEGLRYMHVPPYTGIIFRRHTTELETPGGLWSTVQLLCMKCNSNATFNSSEHVVRYKSGARLKFAHLEHEKTKFEHQGGQYVFIGFDELTHFTETQFFYLHTRNRPGTGCNIKPYMRATCNPDASSWVRKLIDWWINPDTGYPILERSGVIRHFIQENGKIVWVEKDWRQENGLPPTTFTFIPSKIDDNEIGLGEQFLQYKATLNSKDRVEREQLLFGNWNITYSGGMFRPEWFGIIQPDQLPTGIKLLRYWDFAATEVTKDGDDPDWCAGALCGVHDGTLYIVDMQHFRLTPDGTEKMVKQTADIDGRNVTVCIEEERGSSGAFVTDHYQRNVLFGWEVHGDTPSGDKISRAKPWCAMAERGSVKIVNGPWVRKFLAESGTFPLKKKDQIDAVSGAFKMLVESKRVLHAYNPMIDGSGHLVEFKRERDDFNAAEPGSTQVFIATQACKDGSLYSAFFCWSRKSTKLRVYEESVYMNPIPENVAIDMKRRVKVPGSISKIFGNDRMFSRGNNIRRVLLRHAGLRVRPNPAYEVDGAIYLANKMFSDDQIYVHRGCVRFDNALRRWLVDPNKHTTPDAPAFCECLLVVLSVLRKEREIEKSRPFKPYGKRKQEIRRKLRTGEDINLIGADAKQYDYLAK